MKIVWITGASSGIGQSLAKKYSRESYFVILSGRKEEALFQTQKQLQNPLQSLVLAFDVTDKEATLKAIKALQLQNMQPDVYILNAGISQRATAIDTDFSVTEEIINTNLISNLFITKNCLEMIVAKSAHLIVISSVTGKIGTPYRSSYAASKHALHGYYDSLRAELQPKGVHVTLVCPGYIQTNISINARTGDGKAQNTMDKDTEKGLHPDQLATSIYKAMLKNKSELYVGGKEILAIYIKRFFPRMLEKILLSVKPK